MDSDRNLNWTWLIAGALVVAVLATRRGRFWLADKLIDLGIWIQTDEEVRQVDRVLGAMGRAQRRRREDELQREQRRRNGTPPI